MSLEAALRRVLCVMLALLAIVFLIASRAEPARPGEFILAISQEPDNMDPKIGQMVSSSIIRGAILHELTVRDDQWKLVPDLAVEVPTVENGGIQVKPEGGMVTRWKIRPDAKWSDGVPVTAADFLLAYKIALDERQPVVSRDTEERIARIESPDPKTLVVHWKEIYAYSTDYRVLRNVPAHVVGPIYEREGANYHKNAYDGKVGNGPFVLDQWVSGDRLILTPNPHWYGPKPGLKKVTYRIIPSTNTQIVNLISGTVDALSCLSISLDQAIDLEKKWGHRRKPTIISGLTWEHMALRMDDPILSDLRVRQAILYGIDREMMSHKLFEDRQTVADSWLPQRHYGYKSVLNVKQDKERSRRLLEEAGWKTLDKDGIRLNAKGERLELELMTTAGNQVREQVQQVMQSQLKEVGIQLVINNFPGKVFFSEYVNKRNYKHMAMFAWTMAPNSDGLTIWTEDNIPSKENNYKGQNSYTWRNKEATQILHKIQTTLSESERRTMLHRVQELWAAELPAIPLFFRAEISAVPAEMKGWRPTASLVPETWNIHEWALAGVGEMLAQ